MTLSLSPAIAGLSALAPSYSVVLCDIWGVIHNGVNVFEAACEALIQFRERTRGKVILITNAPRPNWWITRQLEELAAPDGFYDAIVTSGDVTRDYIERQGRVKLFTLGPERDRNFYDGLDVEMVGHSEADLVSITGLIDDETETPDDYEPLLNEMKQRGLTVVCANPDIVVERGNKLVYCGGALAEKYREMGGTSLYFGKPHQPIYDLARRTAHEMVGSPVADTHMLAIGDGIMTDVKGANDAGIDCLFITGGIHSAEGGPLAEPTPQSVASFLQEKGRSALGFAPSLVW